MRGNNLYRLSSDLSDEDVTSSKSDKKCFIYLLRFICNKLLIVVKEFCLAFRCVVDCIHASLSNFHSFTLRNPPAFLFLVNIAFFTIILSIVALSLTVTKNIKSTTEWRTFLESFSQLELCIIPFTSNTSVGNIYSNQIQYPKSSLRLKTHHIPIRLAIQPTFDYLSSNCNISHLQTTMYGKYMGLKGTNSQTIINVTLTFEHYFNSSCRHDNHLIQAGCHADNVLGCVSFTAPLHVFPENKHLDHCPAPLERAQQPSYNAGLNWQLPDVDALYYCRSRTTLKGQFDEFLSARVPKYFKHEVKPETQKHIFKTCLFLLIILLIFLLYAILFNHSPHPHTHRLSSSESHKTGY